jgi:hypothetical protein
MTVEVETSRVVYVGDGDTGPFAISFYFIANADIKAVKVLIADGTETALVLDTDFTLDGAGDEAGGTLTLTESIDSTYRLVIYRDPAPLQETAYPANDPFPSASHEQVADRLTMVAQRTQSLVERSLRQPDGDADDIDALPAKATRASKYLAFDADGNPTATNGTTEENPVSVFMATVLDDADAATARATLGVPSTAEAILDTIIDAAGDLILGTAADTPGRLAIGTASHVLTSDGTTAAWEAPRIQQNSQSADYTLVLADSGKHILHPAADTNNRTFTIPANASVAYPVGTCVTFVNEVNTVTIAITSDTLTLAGAGSTGSRTLAANGIATAIKITSTKWMISGTGLT